MNLEARIAFIQAQTACMLADMEGMKSDNQLCEHNGDRPPWTGVDFNQLIIKYGLDHNVVIGYLQQ